MLGVGKPAELDFPHPDGRDGAQRGLNLVSLGLSLCVSNREVSRAVLPVVF